MLGDTLSAPVCVLGHLSQRERQVSAINDPISHPKRL